ncbi:hypothetical protein Pla52o_01270 [Novipirellula galeiformis]|uniref:Uncharacterized protein n=1 Tax=Novipirellula galeiformis TaxID=2528004 RepID=A0A5C6CRT9_9BACT|nr:hypothetical protein Pla52o_01270 [Novipirellula galeiformis]
MTKPHCKIIFAVRLFCSPVIVAPLNEFSLKTLPRMTLACAPNADVVSLR